MAERKAKAPSKKPPDNEPEKSFEDETFDSIKGLLEDARTRMKPTKFDDLLQRVGDEVDEFESANNDVMEEAEDEGDDVEE